MAQVVDSDGKFTRVEQGCCVVRREEEVCGSWNRSGQLDLLRDGIAISLAIDDAKIWSLAPFEFAEACRIADSGNGYISETANDPRQNTLDISPNAGSVNPAQVHGQMFSQQCSITRV